MLIIQYITHLASSDLSVMSLIVGILLWLLFAPVVMTFICRFFAISKENYAWGYACNVFPIITICKSDDEPYSTIFQGEEICHAFKTAKDCVRLKYGQFESSLFLMLTQEGTTNHQCHTLPEFQDGKSECLSDHNKIKLIHQKIQHFKFRDR